MRLFCSICQEIFIPYSEVKITECGHLFHDTCISRWIKQHRSCPRCRNTITKTFKVYFDVEKDNGIDPSTLEHQIETLSDKLLESEKAKKVLQKEHEEQERTMEEMRQTTLTLTEKNGVLNSSIKALKQQVTKLAKQTEMISGLQREVEMWKNKVTTLDRVENLLKGSVDTVNEMVETTPVTELAVRQLCTYVAALKVELSKNETKNLLLRKENKSLLKMLEDERTKEKQSNVSEDVLKTLMTTCSALEKELQSTKSLLQVYKIRVAERTAPKTPTIKEPKKASKKRQPVFDLDIDFLDSENKKNAKGHDDLSKSIVVKSRCSDLGHSFVAETRTKSSDKIKSKDLSKTVSHWEELVSAGTSRNFGTTLNKSRSICNTTVKDDKELSGSYAFDGMGGRKKIRLGGPTPKEEFEKIKKKDDKKNVTANQRKVIFEYCNYGKL